MRARSRIALTVALVAVVAAGAAGQSGRQSASERGKQVIHIVVEGDGSGAAPALRKDDFDLYEGGEPQTLETLQLDQSPARIALLVDNTKTLKIGVDQLKQAAHALINELFEGDQMMVVGYDESPYVLQEFTTNLGTLDATADEKFQKSGSPRLFDAINATMLDALATVGSEKRAIVLLTDGYDSGSQTKFDEILATLQRDDIIVYVLQAPDRTRNASRLEGPKPLQAVQRLTEGTGGRAFPLASAASAAKAICAELRLNWYRGVYTPRGVDRLMERNLLLMRHDQAGPTLRTKSAFPGRKTNT
jgi:Ca-activated chloride channel family protein